MSAEPSEVVEPTAAGPSAPARTHVMAHDVYKGLWAMAIASDPPPDNSCGRGINYTMLKLN